MADLLELWEGEEEEWSNGVVVELGKRFWCPEVVTAAIRLVARLLGIHLQRLTREVRDRVRHCLARTESMVKKIGNKFELGTVERDNFLYCGHRVKQDQAGNIQVDQQEYADAVK